MGSSLQCAVTIWLPSSPRDSKLLLDVLARYCPAELADMFVVSQVRVGAAPSEEGSSPEWIETVAVGGGGVEGVSVSVTPPEAHKCPRCWRYVATVEDWLCGRCEGVVGEGVD